MSSSNSAAFLWVLAIPKVNMLLSQNPSGAQWDKEGGNCDGLKSVQRLKFVFSTEPYKTNHRQFVKHVCARAGAGTCQKPTVSI